MKITRDKALPSNLTQYQIKQYPIQMVGGVSPIMDPSEIAINEYSASKVTFTAGDNIFEIRGNFGTKKITNFTDLLSVTTNFTSITQFQNIDGNKTLRLLMERTSTDIGIGINKIIQGLEDGDLFGAFAGSDEIYGTDFINGSDNGSLGTRVTGDLLRGWGGNDKIYGYGGDDEIWGGSGNDLIEGGSDNDTLAGGSGNDKILGGEGRDVIYGGTGRDYFEYEKISESGITNATRDVIKDFSRSQGDKIDLRTIDAKSGGTSNDVFSFDSTAPTSDGTASNGKIWYSSGVLYGSTDSDQAEEFSIEVALAGISTSTATDYLFL